MYATPIPILSKLDSKIFSLCPWEFIQPLITSAAEAYPYARFSPAVLRLPVYESNTVKQDEQSGLV